VSAREVGLPLALLTILAGCASGTNQSEEQQHSVDRVVVDESDLCPGKMQGEQVWRGRFDVSSATSLPATVEVTSKGNGWLAIANADVRIYDGHDDGNLFEPPMLRVLSRDVNGDGLMDLVVVGNRVHTGEKGGEHLRAERVAAVLLFDSGIDGFRVIEDLGSLVELRAADAAGRVSIGSK
jgi:hypothetical protein